MHHHHTHCVHHSGLQDEFSNVAEKWNDLRTEALHTALYKYLYPQMAAEFHNKLLDESKDYVKLVHTLERDIVVAIWM